MLLESEFAAFLPTGPDIRDVTIPGLDRYNGRHEIVVYDSLLETTQENSKDAEPTIAKNENPTLPLSQEVSHRITGGAGGILAAMFAGEFVEQGGVIEVLAPSGTFTITQEDLPKNSA